MDVSRRRYLWSDHRVFRYLINKKTSRFGKLSIGWSRRQGPSYNPKWWIPHARRVLETSKKYWSLCQTKGPWIDILLMCVEVLVPSSNIWVNMDQIRLRPRSILNWEREIRKRNHRQENTSTRFCKDYWCIEWFGNINIILYIHYPSLMRSRHPSMMHACHLRGMHNYHTQIVITCCVTIMKLCTILYMNFHDHYLCERTLLSRMFSWGNNISRKTNPSNNHHNCFHVSQVIQCSMDRIFLKFVPIYKINDVG